MNYYNFLILQNHDPLADHRIPRVADREDEYRRRFRNRQLSPERVDVFADGMYLFLLFYIPLHFEDFYLVGFIVAYIFLLF